MINLENLKEYINNKYPDKYRIISISRAIVIKKRYLESQIHSDVYRSRVNNGYLDIDMIESSWIGWVTRDRTPLPPASSFSERRRTSFNYEVFIEWERNYKLEKILS